MQCVIRNDVHFRNISMKAEELQPDKTAKYQLLIKYTTVIIN